VVPATRNVSMIDGNETLGLRMEAPTRRIHDKNIALYVCRGNE
jgi:hypothetical protein